MLEKLQQEVCESNLELVRRGVGMPVNFKKVIDNLESIACDQEYISSFEKDKPISAQGDKRKVFIVHGHDINTRDTVEQLLRRIGLTPVIMMNEASKGLTLIEKLEIDTDVGFAIVLYTACDVGRDRNCRKNCSRARQNVVFEHGYLMSKLGRNRIVALVDPGVETLGDLSGLIYIEMGKPEWKLELMRELKAAGYEFDATMA